MKKIIFLVVLMLSISGTSQTTNIDTFEGKTLHNNIRLNYILISQPVDKVNYNLDPKMGFVGLNYNFSLNKWLYSGVGFHGAVSGDQGGFFTLGVNLGINKKLYKNIFFDANIHFGGGGGFRSLVNGGGFIYSNIGLQYKRKNYSFGVQYGYMDFFTGIIKDNNVSFFIEIPSVLRYTSYKNAKKTFTSNTLNKTNLWKKPAVKSVQQITFDYFFPIGKSRTDASTTPIFKPINNTLSVLGFEYQRYLTPSTFVFAQVDAMYGGLTSGFMDVFFGMGKNFIETKYINFFGKFALGAAGGRIYPEGGFTMYPSAGFDVKLFKKMGVSFHGGYHRALGATFEAYTAGFSLKYYGLSGGTVTPFTNKKVTSIRAQGVSIGVHNQTFFNVAKFGIPYSDLQLIALKIAYDINHRFYISGEASFAYEGKSGGYAHGVFGVGIKTNTLLNDKISLFLETGVGVAGGGRVDAGQGVLIRPLAGVNYHVNESLTLNLSGGHMVSPYGNVNSSNINLGLTYSLSILNAKK